MNSSDFRFFLNFLSQVKAFLNLLKAFGEKVGAETNVGSTVLPCMGNFKVVFMGGRQSIQIERYYYYYFFYYYFYYYYYYGIIIITVNTILIGL